MSRGGRYTKEEQFYFSLFANKKSTQRVMYHGKNVCIEHVQCLQQGIVR